ncbi:MAG: molybdopterin-synthase adenylyltransferase MoeB [Calditrichae bacterium]|nr:molybdopterin-synthase adenylyltransferase MoeB [Calditrichia bacterium]
MKRKNNFTLNPDEIFRYSRQIVLPEIGITGQEKLKESSVLIIGVGGLGSVQALYLAGAGVGRIGLIDDDVIDISNLHRQVIYSESDAGVSKVSAVEKRLRDLNPFVQTDVYNELLTAKNAEKIVKEYDIIIDGSDNFSTRYLVNDICVFFKKPVIYGSVYRFDGQVSVFDSKNGPCYRCLYPEPPPPGMVANCIIGGVLGTLPGTVGLIQATEAIKIICGIGSSLSGYLLIFNIQDWDFQKIKIVKNPDCRVCGKNPVITSLINYEKFCGEEEIILPAEWEISAPNLQKMMASHEKLSVIDIREPQEVQICRLAGTKLIPEKEFVRQPNRFDKKDQIVLFCRSGIRSARAVVLFREKGFSNIRHLRGGIIAWIEEIDSSLPRY